MAREAATFLASVSADFLAILTSFADTSGSVAVGESLSAEALRPLP
jgi:hypothetical protein